jgi:hypothetical protein
MTVEDSLHSLLDNECLLFHCDWLGSDLRIGHLRITKDELRMPNDGSLRMNRSESKSQSYFTTCGLPPISSSWRQAPWDPRPEFLFYNWTVAVIFLTRG